MNDSKSPRKTRVARHVAGVPKSGIRDFFEIVVKMKGVISLGIGEPDFVTPWHIREQAVYGLEKGHTAYTSNYGKLSLRKEISRYVASHFGPVYCPDNEILVTVGVSEAVDLAFRAILDPGDEVIYHEPSYVSYPAIASFVHAVPVAVPTYESESFILSPERVRAAITPKTKAILLNFPCNPTVAILPENVLRELAEIAIEHDLIVLTDEIYSELSYDDVPRRSIADFPGMKERTIFLHGFSKAFAMTGLRLGYACGPADIIDAMTKIHQYSIMCASTMAQEAAEEALRNGHASMLKMREAYRMRRDFMVKSLNEMGMPCRSPEGTFYLFPSVAGTGLSERDFALQLLESQKVAVVPGTAFGPSGKGHIRCSYSTSMENLKEAVRRIRLFLETLPAMHKKEADV